MVQDTSDLPEESTDPLSALRDLDVEKFLDGERVAELVRHWTGGQRVRTLSVGRVPAACARARSKLRDAHSSRHNRDGQSKGEPECNSCTQ